MSTPGSTSREEDRSTGRWFRRHPRTALALVTLGALLAMAVVLELGAHLLLADWGPTIGGERTTFCAHDAELGWAHVPGLTTTFLRRDFAIDVKISPDGLRDREYPVPRTAKRRVLVLGDSFGWGYGVELESRFDEILERRHTNWEIVNASVSGYGTDQQLIYLRTRGLAYRPDLVLLLFHANDFRNNGAATQYYTNKPFFDLKGDDLELRNSPVPRRYPSQRAAQWVGRTYLLGRAMQGAIKLVRSLTDDRQSTDGRYGSESARRLTLRLIDEIDRVSRGGGARFALVGVPMDAAKRAALAEHALRRGFPHLPLDETFEAVDVAVTFPHDGHWNARGHRVAAEAIEKFILEHDLLSDGSP